MTEMQREALAVLAEVHVGKGLGYIEDDELIAVLYRHRAVLRARLESTPNEAPQPAGVATSVSESSTRPQAAHAGPS